MVWVCCGLVYTNLQHTQTSSNSSTIVIAVTVCQIPDDVDRVVCADDDGWWYHPKHVEQFPDKINCVTLHLVGYILEYCSWSFIFSDVTSFQIVNSYVCWQLGIGYGVRILENGGWCSGPCIAEGSIGSRTAWQFCLTDMWTCEQVRMASPWSYTMWNLSSHIGVATDLTLLEYYALSLGKY